MIQLKQFTKYFHRDGVDQVLALDGIDLGVQKGDFISIIGSNGAGKSTLLNGLAGTYAPDDGQILFGGKDIGQWPEHRRATFIGRVFQDPLMGTCGALTVEQNLALAKRRGKRRGFALGVKKEDRQLFEDRLKELGLGLENRLGDRVGLLSGGQRQALTMLMATVIPPQVLLLDEHTAALDPKTARQILDLTRKIIDDRHLTTLMVTHNMRIAIQMGNRLIMLHHGKIILDIKGEEKRSLTQEELVARFYDRQKKEDMLTDRMLLG
ncbi:MAG: ABC transporter ATP-binding protein [Desulfatitalea sp. BRH_c12]|nr:MAG: ABC transporter ATP-binding protein [Desulfatitalea sp. BRH_c12]